MSIQLLFQCEDEYESGEECLNWCLGEETVYFPHVSGCFFEDPPAGPSAQFDSAGCFWGVTRGQAAYNAGLLRPVGKLRLRSCARTRQTNAESIQPAGGGLDGTLQTALSPQTPEMQSDPSTPPGVGSDPSSVGISPGLDRCKGSDPPSPYDPGRVCFIRLGNVLGPGLDRFHRIHKLHAIQGAYPLLFKFSLGVLWSETS